MKGISYFISTHIYFTVAMLALNFTMAKQLQGRAGIYFNRKLREAAGGRNERKSIYRRCAAAVRQSIEQYERKEKKAGFYLRAKDKMRKSGYRSEYAAVVYLLLKYIVAAMIFMAALAVNYPSIKEAAAATVLVSVVIEIVVKSERKKLNLKFQRYIYKIYKYLHNQISSGVKVTDAIKTVYEVIDDRELKGILVQLAARYELTLDIDTSLEEFRSNFDIQEAETLCVALKQGVMTGDNQEILARQEDIMFKKYFNYIQAETDSCRNRSTLAAALFTAVIVIMVTVPLLNDVSDAVGRIFVN